MFKCTSFFLLFSIIFFSNFQLECKVSGLNIPIYTNKKLLEICKKETGEEYGLLHISSSGKILSVNNLSNLDIFLYYLPTNHLLGCYITNDTTAHCLYKYDLNLSTYVFAELPSDFHSLYKPLLSGELPILVRNLDVPQLNYNLILIDEKNLKKTYQFKQNNNFDMRPNGITYNPYTSEYIMTPGRYKDAFQSYLGLEGYDKPDLGKYDMPIGGPIYPFNLAFYNEKKEFLRFITIPGIYNTTFTGLAGATSQFYCKLECLSENELLLERRFTKTHEYFPEENPESCTYINSETGASKKLPFEYIAYLDAEKRLAITVDRYDGKNPKLYQILDDGETKLLSDFTASEKKLILNQPIGESISLLAPADMQWEQYFIIDKIGSRLENVYFKQDFKIDSTNYTMILRYNMEKQAFVPVLCIEKYDRCFVDDDGSLYFEIGDYAY